MAHAEQEITTDIESLMHQHQAAVWHYLRYLGATTAESDDLTQETFLALMRSPFEDRGAAAARAYLRQIARHQLLMLRRRKGRELDTVQLEAAEDVWFNVVDEVGVHHFLNALDRCREQLSGRSRDVVKFFYIDGGSRAEVAERMKLTTDGVKTLLRRTRQLLRQCVERETNP